jgi:hypothetical protein
LILVVAGFILNRAYSISQSNIFISEGATITFLLLVLFEFVTMVWLRFGLIWGIDHTGQVIHLYSRLKEITTKMK